MLILSNAIGTKTVPEEIDDVYAIKRMDFASNSVVAESPNLMDFRLLPSNTTDKLKSVISCNTRVEGLRNVSDCLAYSHVIEEVTVERVSKAKAFSDYIL